MGILVLLALYTVLLLILARRGSRRQSHAGHFLSAGGNLSGRYIYFLLTGLWGSSLLVAELETGFLLGASAIWFGLSTLLMSFLIGRFLIHPFRRLGYVTASGLLGEAYGPWARVLSGLVIGVTFPIFALGNLLAAGTLFHMATGAPLLLGVLLATALVLAYVAIGGMWSVAYTQILNTLVMAAGLLLTAVWALTTPLPHHPLPASFLSPTGAGSGLILVWIGMNLANVFGAQVEYQAILCARDPATARRAVDLSSLTLLVLTVLPTLLGILARSAFPRATAGLAAFLHLLLLAPRPLALLMGVSLWASALSWSAPLLLSGASSLALDVWGVLRSADGSDDPRRRMRMALLGEGLLLLADAAVRPEQIAWWHVFGLTLRNGVLFAPTMALLYWRRPDHRAVLTSMGMGVGAGLLWNGLSGFSPTRFFLGIDPMWVSLTASLLSLTLLGVFAGGRWRLRRGGPWTVDLLLLSGVLALSALLLGAGRPLLALAGGAGPALSLLTFFLQVWAMRRIGSPGPEGMVRASPPSRYAEQTGKGL